MEVNAHWWLHPSSDKQHGHKYTPSNCSKEAFLRISTSVHKRKHKSEPSAITSKLWPVQAAALKFSTAQTAQAHDQGVLLDTHVPRHFDASVRVPSPITPAASTRPWPDWDIQAQSQEAPIAHDLMTPYGSVLLSPVQQKITAKALPVVQMVERSSQAAVARYQDRLCFFREVSV
jgi:hypothetical protein